MISPPKVASEPFWIWGPGYLTVCTCLYGFGCFTLFTRFQLLVSISDIPQGYTGKSVNLPFVVPPIGLALAFFASHHQPRLDRRGIVIAAPPCSLYGPCCASVHRWSHANVRGNMDNFKVRLAWRIWTSFASRLEEFG